MRIWLWLAVAMANDSLGRRCGYFDQWYWTGA